MRRWLHSLLLLSLVAVSPAHAAWREARSQHFVIYSEQNAKSLQEFAESLERYDRGLRQLFRVADNQTSHASRVTVFVLQGLGAVRRTYGNSSASIGGFYRNLPSGPVAFVPRSTGGGEEFGFDSRIVLQHEYAHHFLMQNFSFVSPAWFNEGFAEFASTADRQKDGSLTFGLAAQHRAYTLLLQSPLPIEKLLGGGPATKDETAKFYGRSWLLCHYLVVDPARHEQLSAYLRRLNNGEPSLEAARAAFGDLKQLDRDLSAYLKRIQSKMAGFRLPAAMLPIGPVTVRELNAGEAAVMDVRIQSRAGVNKEEAATVVAVARKAAAPFPSDPTVQTALAEAEFDAGHYAEAEAAADRAIAADPKSIDALTYKGAARMIQTADAGKVDAASWTEVRKWFLAANRVDPEDPEPLSYFYRSYLRQGIEPTPNALDGAIRALELAPQDAGLRMMVIHRLLWLGRASDARAALLRLAATPHGDELRDRAAGMIAALDSGGAQAALRLLTGSAGPGAGAQASSQKKEP